MLELRKAGATVRQIAEQVGMAPSSVCEAIKESIREITGEPASDVLQLELQRLDAMFLGLWPRARGGNVHAIDRCLRIMERRADYLGLDAADRVEVSGPSGAPIAIDARSDLIERLSRLVAGAAPGADQGGGPGSTQPR